MDCRSRWPRGRKHDGNVQGTRRIGWGRRGEHKEQTQPNDTIFVIANNPEFYFLAERRNPFRFWNTAVGVRNEQEASGIMNVLKNAPPKIIVIDPTDRNNTSYSNEMIAYVRSTYTLIKTVSNFEIYRAP